MGVQIGVQMGVQMGAGWVVGSFQHEMPLYTAAEMDKCSTEISCSEAGTNTATGEMNR